MAVVSKQKNERVEIIDSFIRFISCCIDQLSREEGREEGKLYAYMQKLVIKCLRL